MLEGCFSLQFLLDECIINAQICSTLGHEELSQRHICFYVRLLYDFGLQE